MNMGKDFKEQVVNRDGRLIRESDAIVIRIYFVRDREGDINAPSNCHLYSVH